MTAKPALRRLLDLPGMAELERKALMTPRYADEDARSAFPEIDETSRALFGLTADEADEVPRPAGWDGVERKSPRDQVAAFEAEGWDVNGDNRRPLRMLGHFSTQLWLALRGVAGTLPFQAPPDETDAGKSSLAADAKAFLRSRR
jgi:hypothetical protein